MIAFHEAIAAAVGTSQEVRVSLTPEQLEQLVKLSAEAGVPAEQMATQIVVTDLIRRRGLS